MFQTINFVPPPPSVSNPAVPPMLNFIVAKILAKKLDERYQDARDLANDLRDCLAKLRQMNEPTWPGQPARGLVRPLPSLLDADEQTQLLAGAAQLTRVTDAHEDAPGAAPAFGISRTFDSLEATQRLAVQTGMAREFDDYAETLRVAAPAATAVRAAAMAPSTPAFRVVSAPPGPRELRRPPQNGWGRREWWTFGIGLAAAVVIAAAIVYA
jgi:serine/threonine-protein kinase